MELDFLTPVAFQINASSQIKNTKVEIKQITKSFLISNHHWLPEEVVKAMEFLDPHL